MPTYNEKILYYKKNNINNPLNIKYAGITFEDKNYFIKRRNSNMYIFEYVTKGIGYICYEGETYKIQAGDCFLMGTDVDYSYYADKIQPFEKLWFCGDGELMSCFFNSYFNGKKMIIVKNDFKSDFDNIHLILKDYKENEDNYLALSNSFCNLMTKIYLSGNKTVDMHKIEGDVSIDEKAIYIKNHIDDNLTQRLNIEQLCAHLYLSKVQLIRLFKKEYGITPYAYYLQGKMEVAENLLINTSLRIKEIAHRVGFEDEFYFSNSFKKHNGISPYTVRKLLARKNDNDYHLCDNVTE